MKRSVCCALVCALLLLLLCAPAAAAGTDATINGRLYATLGDAVAAAVTGDVIRLQRDAAFTELDLQNKTVVIDVNGHVPTLEGAVQGSGLLILQNCYVYNANVASASLLFDDNGAVYFFGTTPEALVLPEETGSYAVAANGTVAVLGNTGYQDLSRALDNARDGASLYLLADWQFDPAYVLSAKRLILDAKGYSISNLQVTAKGILLLLDPGDGTSFQSANAYRDAEGRRFIFGSTPIWDVSRLSEAAGGQVVERAAVCTLDGTNYYWLSEALRDALDGSQIVLLQDCTVGDVVSVTGMSVFLDPNGHTWSGSVLLDPSASLATKSYGANSGTISAPLTYEAAGWTWFLGKLDSVKLAPVDSAYTGRPVAAGDLSVTALGQDVTPYVEAQLSYYRDERCTIPAVEGSAATPPTEPGQYWAMASVGRYLSDPAPLLIQPDPEEAEAEKPSASVNTLLPFFILVGVIVVAGGVIFLLRWLKSRKS